MNMKIFALLLVVFSGVHANFAWSFSGNHAPLPTSEGELPLLEKRINPGFAPIEDRFFISCQIFSDKIVLIKGVSGLYTKTVSQHQLHGDVVPLILAASKGLISSTNVPVDLPTATYAAYAPASLEGSEIKLYGRVYNGNMIYRNDTPEAMLLVSFLDINCNF